MDERLQLKYKKVLDVLSDVADCADKKLILVGGTALALFHLNHRISIDLDFVPVDGNDIKLKESFKGCLSKKGYRTQRGAYLNQFIIQFEDTGIKIEVFIPIHKVKKYKETQVGNSRILIASIDDLLTLKLDSYSERHAARDLFDIVFILKEKKAGFGLLKEVIKKHGLPEDLGDIEGMVLNDEDYQFFKKVIEDASKAGG